MKKDFIKKKTDKDALFFIIIMLALPMAQFLVYTVYANLNTFIMAFQTFDYENDVVVFAGLDNLNKFVTEFTTNTMWKRAIWNSLGYFPVSSLITLPLSIISAYFLFKKIPFSKFFSTVFYLPSVISIVVMALVFRSMFEYSTSPINNILTNVFGMEADEIPIWLNDQKWTMPVLYLYAIWAGIGSNVILLFGAIARVPTEVSEAATIDGCGMFRELISIYVPIIWPTVSMLFMFGISTCFSIFLHTQVLTDGAGDSWTLASIIMSKVKNGSDLYYCSFLSCALVVIAVPIVQISKHYLDKAFTVVET